MSKPTSETPPERPNETPSNKPDSSVEERVDTTLPDTQPAVDGVEETPATDVSLISGAAKPREYKADNQSFFMQRGYQVLLVLGLIAAFFLVMVYQTLFGRIEQPKQMVTIEQGQSYYAYCRSGNSKSRCFLPRLPSSIKHKSMPLHAGIYQLPENPTFAETLHILGQGVKASMVKVQIIEGKTSKDLYQTLRDNKGIKKEVLTDDSGNDRDNAGIAQALDLVGILPNEVINSSDPIVNHNLEGWFAPDTYYYGEGSTDKQVLTDLYKRQQQVLTEAWENRAPNLPYKTPYEALVMASIIEKETSVAEERPLVSAVFRNRLDKGMRMQTDPTIIYGMGSRYEGNIRRKDIDEKTAYNTYQMDGLPPTPIALPSAASIEATLHPADSDALYFVATGNGGHKFTNSLAAHNQAVKEYLGVMREKKSQTPPQ
ncbi:LOW QUALITY PROTEIN: protein YceG like [Psychrobacter sp. JCM 18903]|nr:LOW QUALITY PROTEIN: protein YceG like [Psychrobacter sp. JCM 18903]